MHRPSFEEDYEFTVEKSYGGGFSVVLSHQCDQWEIVGADVDDDCKEPNDEGYPAYPLRKELAVQQMELFIKRAQEALEKLKNLN